MPRNSGAMPAKIALMTDESYASCPLWQALMGLYPQNLVALNHGDGVLSRVFPQLEEIWFKTSPEQSEEELRAFLRRILDANPQVDLILCLAENSSLDWQRFYELEIRELLFVEEITGNPRFVERTSISVQRRRLRESEEKKARNHLKQALQSKNEHLAWLSHEIRTPLNGLMGLMEILQSSHLDSEQSEMLEVMNRCSKTVLGLVSDVLDLSKLEAAKMRLDQETFALDKLVEDSLFLYSRQAQLKGLMVYFISAPEVPAEVVGDSRKLSQILNNLISNAVKYTGKGRVRVSLDLERQQSDSTCLLRFEVKDTGYGISKDELPQVFAPFEQTSSHRLHKGPGSGLGMTLTKQLVELMGGQVEVSSEAGKGTSFVVVLPFALPDHAERTEVEAVRTNELATMHAVVVGEGERAEVLMEVLGATGLRVERRRPKEVLPSAHFYFFAGAEAWTASLPSWERHHSANHVRSFIVRLGSSEHIPQSLLGCQVLDFPLRTSDFGRRLLDQVPAKKKLPELPSLTFSLMHKRILVVDDDPLNLRVAKRQLSRLSAHITVAQSGLEALGLLDKESFDLIFVDWQMPHMDGSQLLQVMRAMPDLSRVTPVIALTALAGVEDRQRILAEGFDDYLAKPAQMEDIVQVLERWLPSEVSFKKA